jgi:hypothetical protein
MSELHPRSKPVAPMQGRPEVALVAARSATTSKEIEILFQLREIAHALTLVREGTGFGGSSSSASHPCV